MPTLTRYKTEQEMNVATIRKGKNVGLLDLPVYTWRCSCGTRLETMVRWYDVACGKCKRGMDCTQTKGVLTSTEMYR